MIETFRKLRDLLSERERKRSYLLLGMIVISGLVEMITISAMFPFLAIVAKPSVVETNATLAGIYAFLGFSEPRHFLVFAGVAVFLVIVVGLAFATVTQYAIYRFSAMRGSSISLRLLQSYLRQPYAWFLDQHSATMESSILTEVNEVVQRCLLPAMNLLAQGTVVIMLIALLVAAEPVAALTAALLIGGAYALIYAFARKRLARMGAQRTTANLAKFKVVGEAVGGIKDVKLLGLEETFVRRFRTPSIRAALANAAFGVASEAPRNALRAVALGGILFFVVVMLAQGGDIGALLPILGLYAFAGLRLLPALQQVYFALTAMRFARPVLDKVHADVMNSVPLVEDNPSRPAPPAIRLRERLELVDVHYAYPSAERGALSGLSLSIPARTTIGIVGGTGAGKTTAVDVILGFLRPQQGALVIDGVAVTDDLVRGWQKSIGYVPQHIFLTDDTVVANIAFGIDPADIDMAAIEKAARIAELHDFILERSAPGLRDHARRARRAALGRPAPAHRHRARALSRAGRARARRSDERARQPDRAGGDGRGAQPRP